MQLDNLRREYLQDGLRRKQLNDDPILQFEAWMQQAINAGLAEPNAMTLATVNEQGQPEQRIVLLKHLSQQGFVFFTNLSSAKAQAIAHNSRVSLHFPWHTMERQVKICGQATLLAREAVADYFASRPENSKLGAWASEQSQVIPSRDYLMEQYQRIKSQYAGKDIPLPDFWGGYCVKPLVMEFWQGGEYRLHDCFRYTLLDNSEWQIDRLAP